MQISLHKNKFSCQLKGCWAKERGWEKPSISAGHHGLAEQYLKADIRALCAGSRVAWLCAGCPTPETGHCQFRVTACNYRTLQHFHD